MTYRIQILGASYGSLMAAKLLQAGHHVGLVCTSPEVGLINKAGIVATVPINRGPDVARIDSQRLPGSLVAAIPTDADPGDFDLVVLAMQEPQYRSPEIRNLISRIAAAKVPCLSIMNMPPLPFLERFAHIDSTACRPCYTDPSVWDELSPNLVTHSSADPQASRVEGAPSNEITVRLASNFRAARFCGDDTNRVLRELAMSVEGTCYVHKGQQLTLPVKLKISESSFVALSKWPMLITGNYRCITTDGPQSIETAVHCDLVASRAIYRWVCDLCLSLGANISDLIPFEKYASASHALKAPSSAARALANGAEHIERIDLLVQTIGAQHGLHLSELDDLVELVDSCLVHNRA